MGGLIRRTLLRRVYVKSLGFRGGLTMRFLYCLGFISAPLFCCEEVFHESSIVGVLTHGIFLRVCMEVIFL